MYDYCLLTSCGVHLNIAQSEKKYYVGNVVTRLVTPLAALAVA